MAERPINPGMDAHDVEQFLHTCFDYKPDDAWMLLWTLSDKTSHWHDDVDLAIAEALAHPDSDLYFGPGLTARRRSPNERAKSDEVSGIIGLWTDIDYAVDGAHEKAGLPPDEDSAMRILRACGHEPSILWHSGHGLQALWLFAEPWMFENDVEHEDAAELALRWNATIAKCAAQEGQWIVDQTYDLPRVLRLPGSVNHKLSHEPVRARIIEINEKRYATDEFVLADRKALSFITGRRSTYAILPNALKLNLDAKVSEWEKFKPLIAENVFKNTWEWKRPKFPSASEYCMALADYAVQAGWSDQEICDLLVEFRRRQNKLGNKKVDWYARTIATARDSVLREESLDETPQRIEELEMALATGSEQDAAHRRAALLDSVAEYTKCELVRVEWHKADPPQALLVGANGRTSLVKNMRDFVTPDAMHTHFIHICGSFARLARPAMDKISNALLASVIEVDIGVEATRLGRAHTWVSDYIAAHKLGEDFDRACAISYPARSPEHGDAIFIPSARFRKWLRQNGEKVDDATFGQVMRSFCTHLGTVWYTNADEKRSRTRGWLLPEDYTVD